MKIICKGHNYCEYGFKNINTNDHYCKHSIPHECDNGDNFSFKHSDCDCSEIFLRIDKLKKIQKLQDDKSR